MPGTRAGSSLRVNAGRKAAEERKRRVPLRYERAKWRRKAAATSGTTKSPATSRREKTPHPAAMRGHPLPEERVGIIIGLAYPRLTPWAKFYRPSGPEENKEPATQKAVSRLPFPMAARGRRYVRKANPAVGTPPLQKGRGSEDSRYRSDGGLNSFNITMEPFFVEFSRICITGV